MLVQIFTVANEVIHGTSVNKGLKHTLIDLLRNKDADKSLLDP